ncbi:unnamed protein product [Adineta steineri]|uniref:Uncharacterized protein n=1 Tax=Adineta steineri TaxID=433720 RepID=A0A815T2P6_9BILA|nr:unnamed protein product [Adineta steineri]CAF1643617.1 unnamed protein product [Adineta steineri]
MLRLRFRASWLPVEHNQFWTIIDFTTTNIITINDLLEYFIEQQKLFANYYEFHLSKRSTKLKYLKAFVNDYVLPPHAQVNQILRDNDEIDFRLEIDAQTDWLSVKSPPTSKRKQSVERLEIDSQTEWHSIKSPPISKRKQSVERLEIDSQTEWHSIKSPPISKRKQSVERLEIDAQTEWHSIKSPPISKRKLSIEREIPRAPSPPPHSSNSIDDILRTIAQPSPSSTNSPETDSFSFQFGNKRGRPIPPRPQVISAVKINSLVPRQVMKNRK